MIQSLPEKLKMLRSKYGYSQKQVAAKAGVSASIISGYETGERTPSTDILLSLSNIYHCSVDYLLGKQPEIPPVLIDTNGLTDKQVQAIFSIIDAIINQ